MVFMFKVTYLHTYMLACIHIYILYIRTYIHTYMQYLGGSAGGGGLGSDHLAGLSIVVADDGPGLRH